MGHTITLTLPDKTWEDLLRAGRDRNEPLETVAGKLLSDIVSDPFMSLSGCLEYLNSDAERLGDFLCKESATS